MDLLNIIKRARSVFGLGSGEIKIIQYLAEKGGGLVKEIATNLHKSDRIVRKYLKHLISLGFVTKKVVITGNKKLAYLYTLSPEIGKIVKRKLKELAESIP